jgi:hypothetical protein
VAEALAPVAEALWSRLSASGTRAEPVA